MNPSHSECALELSDSPHRRHEVSRSSRVFLYDVVTHSWHFRVTLFEFANSHFQVTSVFLFFVFSELYRLKRVLQVVFYE